MSFVSDPAAGASWFASPAMTSPTPTATPQSSCSPLWGLVPPRCPAAAQPGGPRVRPAPAYRLGPPSSGRRSPARRSATHEASLKPHCRQAPRNGNFERHCTCQRQQCMLTTARSHSAEHAHVWHFVHVYPFFWVVKEDSQALHLVPPLNPFRLASHHNTRRQPLRRSQTWLWSSG